MRRSCGAQTCWSRITLSSFDPTHSVATDDWKGSVLHRLIRGGCALYTAHTNADVAHDGVNDALAEALGLANPRPLRARPQEPADKLVTFVPPDHADAVIAALQRVGAGTIGNYTGCAWKVSGTGTFTPGEGANPIIGRVGRTEVTAEARVEMLVPRMLRSAALDAVRSAHPYEEVAVDVIELSAAPSGTGLGRVGDLNGSVPLAAFARLVADALPSTPAGVRFHGDPDTVVERVAVCGGSGDGLLAEALRAGVDAFVTADLRHHRASEALAAGGPALVDPGHWASEWPWLPVAADRLLHALARTRPERRYGGDTHLNRGDRPRDRPRPVQSRGGPLKASPAEQARLLDLQAIDQTLAHLEHRRRNLPEVAELRDLATQQQSVHSQLVAAQTEASDIAREQDKLESDIDQVRQRMTRDQQRLESGAITSAKDLESLQHEVGSLHKRQRDLEDVELEVMERLEEAEKKATALGEEQTRLAAAVEDTERRRVAAHAAIDKDVEFRSATAGNRGARYWRRATRLLREAPGTARRHRCGLDQAATV